MAPLDVSECFDRQPGKIHLFLAHIEDRAQRFNWQDILTIPVGTPPVNYNRVCNYGWMSLQDVQAKAQTYMGQQVQSAQDLYMLYLFDVESLTDMLTFKAQVCAHLRHPQVALHVVHVLMAICIVHNQ